MKSNLKPRAGKRLAGDGAGLRYIDDCRTPLAFANVMPEGNIGVIGASVPGFRSCARRLRWQGRELLRDWPWRARPQP